MPSGELARETRKHRRRASLPDDDAIQIQVSDGEDDQGDLGPLLPGGSHDDDGDGDDDYKPVARPKIGPADGVFAKMQKVLLFHARPIGRENDDGVVGDSPMYTLWRSRRGPLQTVVYAPMVLVYGILYFILMLLAAFLYGLGDTLACFTAAGQVLNDDDFTAEMLGQLAREEKMAAMSHLSASSQQTVDSMIKNVLKPLPPEKVNVQKDVAQLALEVDQRSVQFSAMLKNAYATKNALEVKLARALTLALAQRDGGIDQTKANDALVAALGSQQISHLWKETCKQNTEMTQNSETVASLLKRQITTNNNIKVIQQYWACCEQSAEQLSRIRLAMMCGESMSETTRALNTTMRSMGKGVDKLSEDTRHIVNTVIKGINSINENFDSIGQHMQRLSDSTQNN